ncbi:MAG: carboxypeptidase-like regulatory domain-containing protein [Bacteroidota bacterium]
MNRIFLITAALLLVSLQSAISGNPEVKSENKSNMVMVTGQVLDMNTGEALAGVLIKVGEQGNPVYTDFDGKFGIKDITPGSYNVKASLISYEETEVEVDVNLDANDSFSIKLKQAGVK